MTEEITVNAKLWSDDLTDDQLNQFCQMWPKHTMALILREREACARLSESRQWESNAAECSGECADGIARAIRART